MLSFAFRRVLSRPGIFSIAQRLPTRVISSNQSFAIAVQRNFTTTGDRDLDSATDSEPGPKSNPKPTRRKTASRPKTAGKDKKKKKKKKKVVTKPKVKARKKKKKVVTKRKVTINKDDLPPKLPGNPYVLWMRDWMSTQPKMETLELAQGTIKRGAQTWHTISEDEKQQYREKYLALRDEYRTRIGEWREKVDPVVLHELNRRRVAKGYVRIRGAPRPATGYTRFFMHVMDEYPRTEGDYQTYFKALAARVSSQWRAMNDAEKAEYKDLAKTDQVAWREKRQKAKSQAKA